MWSWHTGRNHVLFQRWGQWWCQESLGNSEWRATGSCDKHLCRSGHRVLSIGDVTPHPGWPLQTMADTIFGSGCDQWVCPNDRQLALRAKLHTGWSVHTYQTEKQRKSQSLSPAEVEAILQVIQRAERLDILEQQRVGRLVERLETMRRNVMGNGLSQCLLCGEVLGFLGSSSVFCKDCRKKVCTKCGIEASPSQKRPLWLCKICSEQREVWKRSGAWFYKGIPKFILPLKIPGQADHPSFRPLPVEPAEQEPRSTETSRVYTWARWRGAPPQFQGSGFSLRWLLLWSTGSRCAGSVVTASGLSCPTACGILLDQGSNPCPLHWHADS
uniref:Rab effector Noc2 n=1 Tax=Bos mutus grunniens TaxID=30521 RepID=A0A8B9XLB1_BOSMU